MLNLSINTNERNERTWDALPICKNIAIPIYTSTTFTLSYQNIAKRYMHKVTDAYVLAYFNRKYTLPYRCTPIFYFMHVGFITYTKAFFNKCFIQLLVVLVNKRHVTRMGI